MEDQERRKRLAQWCRFTADTYSARLSVNTPSGAVTCFCCLIACALRHGMPCPSCLRLVAESLERVGCTIGKPYLAPPVTIEEDESLEGKK